MNRTGIEEQAEFDFSNEFVINCSVFLSSVALFFILFYFPSFFPSSFFFSFFYFFISIFFLKKKLFPLQLPNTRIFFYGI